MSLRFFCRFVILYGLLVIPWPGLGDAYCRYFRTMGRSVFGSQRGLRMLRFEAAEKSNSPIDTIITMANRDRMGPDGSGPAKILKLDAWSVGWVPTALLLALTMATPIPWPRRGLSVLLGLLLINFYVGISVGSYLWNESTDLGLLTLTPFWKAVADGSEETMITQLGPSFVVPVVIWIFVTFRPREINAIERGRPIG
jgi:hypothetical protein